MTSVLMQLMASYSLYSIVVSEQFVICMLNSLGLFKSFVNTLDVINVLDSVVTM